MTFRRCCAGRARVPCTLTAIIILGALALTPVGAQTPDEIRILDGARPHIDAVLHNPEVMRRITAWGLTVADVQHDVDALSPRERARLAYVLTRQWRTNQSHSQTDLQAQFLVTLSLMRESTLFASIISSGASKLR